MQRTAGGRRHQVRLPTTVGLSSDLHGRTRLKPGLGDNLPSGDGSTRHTSLNMTHHVAAILQRAPREQHHLLLMAATFGPTARLL
jgi:hypothetical protein